jgi:hypothetical protein
MGSFVPNGWVVYEISASDKTSGGTQADAIVIALSTGINDEVVCVCGVVGEASVFIECPQLTNNKSVPIK